MPKQQKTEQKTNTTCICGEEGQNRFSKSLKDGTRQLYCSEECMEDDGARQEQQQGQGKQRW